MRFLSQLRPRRFHSANQVWALAGGTEDNDLWAWNHTVDDSVMGHVAAVTSVFVPDDGQRELIAQGANIALTVIGGQPPVMVRLTDEPLGKPDV
jgi:hypothetical protein